MGGAVPEEGDVERQQPGSTGEEADPKNAVAQDVQEITAGEKYRQGKINCFGRKSTRGMFRMSACPVSSFADAVETTAAGNGNTPRVIDC